MRKEEVLHQGIQFIGQGMSKVTRALDEIAGHLFQTTKEKVV